MNLVLIIFSLVTVLGAFNFQYFLRFETVFPGGKPSFNTQSLTALQQNGTAVWHVSHKRGSPHVKRKLLNVCLILEKETGTGNMENGLT